MIPNICMFYSFLLAYLISRTSSQLASKDHNTDSKERIKQPLEILLPRDSSVWVANGRARAIVFRYTGDEEISKWTIKILRRDGTVVDDYEEGNILHISKFESTSALLSSASSSSSSRQPSKSPTLYFKTLVSLGRQVKPDLHRVQICGSLREGTQRNREDDMCASTEYFNIEGVLEKHLLKHEERFQQRVRAKEDYLTSIDLEKYWPINNTKCTVKRIYKPTKDEFTEECMKPGLACIISGAMDDWVAMTRWPLDVLQSDARLSEGIYIGDRPEMIPLRVYNDYVKNRAKYDASPWMVFMPDVFEMYPELLKDYTVPDFFSDEDDFMMDVPDDLRMDWRWIIMAPRGSGSGWHADPANTTGWLALATGAKLWGLYPPTQNHIPGVKNNFYQKRDYNMDDAFNWWIYTRPYLDTNLPQECVQKAGDIVFIPAGWYHAVLNLDHTVAVTQNFCNKYSIKGCLKELKEQADSDGNFIGRTFEHLRNLNHDKYPEYFEEEDMEFQAPKTGNGLTYGDIKKKQLDDLKRFLSGGL